MSYKKHLSPTVYRLAVLGFAIGILCLIGFFAAENRGVAQRENDGSRDFQPVTVLGPQKPITDPPVIPSERVRRQVTDNELVLGVEMNGEARAYPINMLTGPRREIINDKLGEEPIAATW